LNIEFKIINNKIKKKKIPIKILLHKKKMNQNFINANHASIFLQRIKQ
jgi:hypothetical protein